MYIDTTFMQVKRQVEIDCKTINDTNALLSNDPG